MGYYLHSVVARAYIDNKVKPIAYDYRSTVSAIKPDTAPYLELSLNSLHRFVDVIQNSTHRFFTDVERKKLQGIEEGTIKYIHPSNHPASMISEDATRRFMTDVERTKLNGIESGATKYTHPDKHPATMIAEDEARRFVSDSEKNTWNGKAPGGHKHAKSEITDFPSSMPASDVCGWAKAPNKPSYTATEVGAALASHGHSAGEVSEDVNRRFVSDSEKSNWNSKAAGSHNHDTAYQPKGNYQPSGSYAAALHGHSANQVSEETNRRWMTDAERLAISTLETYAKADFSNITSKSMGQNGYYKLPDGLLIQWGYIPKLESLPDRTVYLPISFYDANYSVVVSVIYDNVLYPANVSVTILEKSMPSFGVKGYAYSHGGGMYPASDPCQWIAVGRWK